MTLIRAGAGLLMGGLLVGLAWQLLPSGAMPLAPEQVYAPPATDLPITPIPHRLTLDPRKVVLGRRLFHDRRLSHDNTVSCATCHSLARAGVDSNPVAVGILRQTGTLNSPTVFNSVFNFRQFWDGRAVSLEEQAAGPVHNPIEMNSDWREVVAKLQGDPDYPRAFAAIWKDGLTAANIQNAIAEFERGLITPNSPFDRYLRGERRALSEQARQGWALFSSLGCIACHQGVNVGGNMYASLGVMGDYFADRGKPLQKSDMGRFNITGREDDRHVFKVPGLRNVQRTGPYFHDGSLATLGQAVDAMVRYQLGVTVNPEQRTALLAFLASLDSPLAGQTP